MAGEQVAAVADETGPSSPPASPGPAGERALWQIRRERSFIRDLVDSIRNPEFWALSAWLDIVVTYRRSRLGVLWLVMPSIVYIWGVGSLFASLWGDGRAHV